MYSLCILWTSEALGQWCCLDSTWVIPDNDSFTIRIAISGAINNDLASPGQGLCGVRIRFDHKYIGDLSIRLVSPGGQSVSLIGPVGDAGFTFLSKWQVSFVPCNQVSVPDPGFLKKWSNLQPWGIFGQFYNGTYYPESGCLEDFNAGPVNGTWNLVVTDHDRFYDGNIQSVCLLFCDHANTTCNSCSPNGGYFDTTEISLCEGSDSLNFSGRMVWPFYTPDSSVYSYEFLIAQNDRIISKLKTPDLRGFPVGQYTICGVSYMTSDSAFIPVGGKGVRLSGFRNDIISNKFGICAEFSKNCLQVDINPDSKVTDTTIVICEGDTLEIHEQKFFQPNLYQLQLVNSLGCDSILNLNLKTVNLRANIRLSPDTITCLNPTALLDATSSLAGMSTVFSWSTDSGNFTDSSDIKMVYVDRQGNYLLTLREGICQDTASVFVKKNADLPDLNVLLDTITCNDSSVWITGSSTVSGVTWQWLDANDTVLSGNDSLLVTTPGIYKVVISDSLGCTSAFNFLVPADTVKPVIRMTDFEIKCEEDSIVLSWVSGDSLISTQWSGPGGFVSDVPFPRIGSEGIYKLIATNSAGCYTELSATVNKEVSDLRIYLDPETLTCKDTQVFIYTTFDQNIQKIEWIGPAGYTSYDLDAIVSSPGKYRTRVTDTKGCIVEDSVEVATDKVFIKASSAVEKLRCGTDSVRISVTYDPVSELDSILWTGPNFISFSGEPWVKQAGWYFLRMVSRSGCISTDSILVEDDFGKPDLNIVSGSINCKNDTVQIKTTSMDGISFNWSGPAAFISSDPSPWVYLPGVYSVTVTGKNGCQTIRSLEIKLDTIRPLVRIDSDTINCLFDSVRLNPVFAVVPDSVIWLGPGNFRSNDPAPLVASAGVYSVWAQSSGNGCISTDSVEIFVDTIKPSYQIQIDSITCSRDRARIRLISGDSILFSEWKLPNGDTVIATTFQSDILGRYFLRLVGRNGCEARDTVLMVASREKPSFSLRADTLTCRDTVSQFDIISSDLNIKYLITLPDQSRDSLISFATSMSGWYVVEARNASDCVTLDSIFIEDRRSLPIISFSDSLFDCNDLSPYRLNLLGLQSGDSLIWKLPNGQLGFNQWIDYPEKGIHSVTLINRFGCVGSDSIQIAYDTSLASVYWQSDTINCSNKEILVGFGVNRSGAIYNWVHADTTISTRDTLLLVNKAGSYHISVQAPNGCKLDTVMVIPLDTSLPSIQVVSDTITCSNPMARLEAILLDTTQGIDFTWRKPNGGEDSLNPIFVQEPGVYRLSIKNNRNGCGQVYFHFVGQDTMAPKIKISMLDTLACKAKPVRLALLREDMSRAVSVSWTTADGIIFWGQDSMVALVDYDANYQVRVRDKVNGCFTDQAIQLKSLISPIETFQLDINRDFCDTTKPIELRVSSIQGGEMPYFISLDSVNFIPVKDSVLLIPGTNRVFLKDGKGCLFDTTLWVPVIKQTILQVFQDTLVSPGAAVPIKGIVNRNSSEIQSVSWDPPDFLDCVDCLITTSRPDKDIMYTLSVVDTLGCLIQGNIQIRVNRELTIYAPNAFSPNGDGVNDFFEINLDPALAKVSRFVVFDRWGGVVFALDGAGLSGPTLRWDGSSHGVSLNPGVYVYQLELTTIDGEFRRIVGDVTLIR